MARFGAVAAMILAGAAALAAGTGPDSPPDEAAPKTMPAAPPAEPVLLPPTWLDSDRDGVCDPLLDAVREALARPQPDAAIMAPDVPAFTAEDLRIRVDELIARGMPAFRVVAEPGRDPAAATRHDRFFVHDGVFRPVEDAVAIHDGVFRPDRDAMAIIPPVAERAMTPTGEPLAILGPPPKFTAVP